LLANLAGMPLSQKCHYGLRALLELALRAGKGPVKVAEIAAAQEIPPRFLEVILNELKQAGFVEARRGKVGGYVLARGAEAISVGEVVRFLDGPLGPDAGRPDVFQPLWIQAETILARLYDSVSFRQLAERH